MNCKELYPGIYLYQNVSREIDLVLELAKYDTLEWQQGQVLESRYLEFQKNHNITDYKQIRDASSIGIPKTPSESDSEVVSLLSEKLGKVFTACGKHYAADKKVEVTGKEENFQLVRYDPGQFFLPHVDSGPEASRKISMIFYLNDDYEGGELELPKIGITLKPIANSVVAFFSDAPEFEHGAKKVISGTKYASVGFLY
jgi:Rps23 Pro-64 3,4-dihydroxylase Tpa1-like proline 4-hydroxylase